MIKFVLEDALKELGITKNKLSVESKVRSNTVIDYANGSVSRMDLTTLNDLLNTMNRIAKEKGLEHQFDITDIIRYELEVD